MLCYFHSNTYHDHHIYIFVQDAHLPGQFCFWGWESQGLKPDSNRLVKKRSRVFELHILFVFVYNNNNYSYESLIRDMYAKLVVCECHVSFLFHIDYVLHAKHDGGLTVPCRRIGNRIRSAACCWAPLGFHDLPSTRYYNTSGTER